MSNANVPSMSRRHLLHAGLVTAAAGFVATSLDVALPMQLFAQSPVTPDAARAELVAGNKRFVSGKLTAHDQDLAILKQHTEEKQEPFDAVLSCADSRVPVELVFA